MQAFIRKQYAIIVEHIFMILVKTPYGEKYWDAPSYKHVYLFQSFSKHIQI